MTEEQFKKAEELKEKLFNINRELEIWDKELTKKQKLSYQQGWNGNHSVDLETNISDGVFEAFRNSAMDNLKLQLVEIEKEFNEI